MTPSSHMCSSRYNALLTDSTWPGHVICMGGLKVRCDHSMDGLKKQYDLDKKPPVHTLFHGTIFSSYAHLAPMQCWMGRVAKSPTELLQSRSAGHARDELHHQGMHSSESSSSRLYSPKPTIT